MHQYSSGLYRVRPGRQIPTLSSSSVFCLNPSLVALRLRFPAPGNSYSIATLRIHTYVSCKFHPYIRVVCVMQHPQTCHPWHTMARVNGPISIKRQGGHQEDDKKNPSWPPSADVRDKRNDGAGFLLNWKSSRNFFYSFFFHLLWNVRFDKGKNKQKQTTVLQKNVLSPCVKFFQIEWVYCNERLWGFFVHNKRTILTFVPTLVHHGQIPFIVHTFYITDDTPPPSIATHRSVMITRPRRRENKWLAVFGRGKGSQEEVWCAPSCRSATESCSRVTIRSTKVPHRTCVHKIVKKKEISSIPIVRCY